MSFKKGQRVILKADKEEGWSEERGVIDGKSGRTTWIVRVDLAYIMPSLPDDMFDDGLREVTADQMELDTNTHDDETGLRWVDR